MAKKLGDMTRFNKNLVSSNAGLFPEDKDEAEGKEINKKENLVKEVGKTSLKTFKMYDSDHNFLKRYARIMASKNDDDFTIAEALREAIACFKEKHPEIPKD